MVVRSAMQGEAEQSDRLFHALSDATRRDIVRTVLAAEHSVSALARRYPMSFAAVQKHVAVLERAQLVHKRRRGREQLVRADIEPLSIVGRLLAEYEAIWRGRFERMAEILDENESETAAAADAPAVSPRRARKDQR